MRGRALGGLLLAITVTLLLSEGLVRVVSPRPRVQVVRPGVQPGQVIEVRDGVPLWYHERDAPRWNLDCLQERPDAPRVLVTGDSILAGVSVTPNRVWSRRLEALWTDGEAPCLVNVAEPGFSFDNELAAARKVVERVQPDLVIMQYWRGSTWDYAAVGGTAYRFSQLRVGADGTPNPFSVPGPVHRWLLPRSRLYEYGLLAVADQLDVIEALLHDKAQVQRYLTAFHDLAREHDAQLMIVFPPRLNTSFDLHARKRNALWTRESDQPGALALAYAREHDLPYLLWDEALAERDADHMELRLDECCHFNDDGHGVLAEIMLPPLQDALRPAPPPSDE